MIDKIKAVYNLWDTEMSSNSHRGDIVLSRCREIKFSGQYIHDIKPPFWGVSYESLRSKVIIIRSHNSGPGHDWSDETLSDYRIYRTLSDYGLFHILDSGVEEADTIVKRIWADIPGTQILEQERTLTRTKD
jgi:hypothetical protein